MQCTSRQEMRQALSQVFREKHEIDEMPQAEKMVKCMDLLLEEEKSLARQTAFFAVETEQGMKFLVQPNAFVPSTTKIMRTETTKQPIRVTAGISG